MSRLTARFSGPRSMDAKVTNISGKLLWRGSLSMTISFTIPTLELGVERSGKERLALAAQALPDQGFALLRSTGLGYRAVSKPELGALVAKLSSPADRLSFSIADPICLVVQRQEIEGGFYSLAPPYGRVIAVQPAGLTIAHEVGLELAHEAALASNLASFGVAPMSSLGDVGFWQPTGMSPTMPGLEPCPPLPPEGRPPGQPFLDRKHQFVHFPMISVCSRDGEECLHFSFHRIPDPANPPRAWCGYCGREWL